MKKLLEERKREKEEEKLARQRVREQIEADKAARRAKANVEQVPKEPPSVPSSSTTHHRKEYNETKLQVTYYISGCIFIYVCHFFQHTKNTPIFNVLD